jgi:hypothetical protein
VRISNLRFIKWTTYLHLLRSNIFLSRFFLKDLDVGGKIILKWILQRGGGMDWIVLAEDRDQWLVLVYRVMNLKVPCKEFF